MHKRVMNALYVMNIVFQAFFTLLTPAALLGGAAWLLVKYAALPEWIYVPAIVLGVFSGFYSMIKFILSAMAGLERLEKEQNSTQNSDKKTDKNGNDKV